MGVADRDLLDVLDDADAFARTTARRERCKHGARRTSRDEDVGARPDTGLEELRHGAREHRRAQQVFERCLYTTAFADREHVARGSRRGDRDERCTRKPALDHGLAGTPGVSALLREPSDDAIERLFAAEPRALVYRGSGAHREELVVANAMDLGDLFVLEERPDGAEADELAMRITHHGVEIDVLGGLALFAHRIRLIARGALDLLRESVWNDGARAKR